MILIKYTDIVDFEYDIQGLIRSFFPGEQMATDKDVEADITLVTTIKENAITLELYEKDMSFEKSSCDIDINERLDMKNHLKRLVYDLLSNYTGRKLDWGTLSGIRPTKITTELVKAGYKDDEIKSIIKEQYYLSGKKADLSIDISKRELEILSAIDYENGYSLYVGIPFCPSTCSYCSFTSYPLSRYRKKVDLYIEALCKEIKFVANAFKHKKLNTVYIGGGTPTTLEPNQSDKLLKTICQSFDFSDVKEFTVEAGRPDSITEEKLKVLKENGVTRISINPQTMNEKTLKLIGRCHTIEQIYSAFKLARDNGFDNINMDFIVGLPGEEADDVRYTMEKASELNPDSVTVHSLAIKRAARMNTSKEEFAGYTYTNDNEIMDITREYARGMGMEPYYLYRQKNMTGNMENVGYSKEGKAGIYNILIMEEKQSIVAVGAGASTKMVFNGKTPSNTEYPDGKRIHRIENVKDVDCYIDRIDEMIKRKSDFLDKYMDEL